MEMLIMAYAFRTSSARKIVGVIPYLPYSKQSKMRKRGCIVSKLLAQMMVKSGTLQHGEACFKSVSHILLLIVGLFWTMRTLLVIS